ncbi:hypothetical protein GEV29_17250 [Aeromicrobium sp. SMF47]|uniref:hypothetical protein n=1 Tax=Aeromicrobium yanjiei TaxID=2662028 RepID=UPI00129DF60E|nr:hypothetical protein [Aeromicrobium yanjiei]MRJ78282.1 hypothetical protein [Aeromicrobium yanjiei]
MSRIRGRLWASLVVVPLLSSCSTGDVQATDRFDTNISGKRVMEAYRVTADAATTVTPPATARHFVISMDCVSDGGSIQVSLTGPPALDAYGEVPCQSTPNRGGPDGSVTITLPDSVTSPVEKLHIAVDVPRHGSWSAAVDARD